MSLLKRAVVPFVAARPGRDRRDRDVRRWRLGQKTLTAYFPRAISLYEGSDVRVLGVAVGTIESVVPEGTRVKVVMRYDDDGRDPGRRQRRDHLALDRR